MWDLFHHIDDVSTESPRADEARAWCQRRGTGEHVHDVIVGDDFVHFIWTDDVVVDEYQLELLLPKCNVAIRSKVVLID